MLITFVYTAVTTIELHLSQFHRQVNNTRIFYQNMSDFRGDSARAESGPPLSASDAMLYEALNDIGEEAEDKKRQVDAIMAKVGAVREKLESPSITAAERTKLATAVAELKPIAEASITEAKEAQDKFDRKVTIVATETRKDAIEVLGALASYHQRIATAKVLEQLKFAQTLDILFVYDVTGSMSPHIKTLSSNIRKILGDISGLNKYLRPRLGLVGYRDPEDGAGHFDIYPFDGSVTKFEHKLEQVERSVGGGGDQCEDVIGALQKATSFEWSQQNRIIFLCADAPCHGTEYHDGCGDNHPSGLGTPSQPIFHQLIEKGVQVVFWKINGTTDKMIRKFNEEASRSPTQRSFPGERPRNEYISTDPMSGGSIAESMRDSIMRSVSASLSKSSSRVKAKDIKHTMKKAATKLASIPEDEAEAIIAISAVSLDAAKGSEGGRF
jgi:hypothetical protein